MAAVVLSAYTDAWQAAFARVRAELLLAFAPQLVKVEHIGSTAVRGLVAKPVLNVLLGAKHLSEIESRIQILAALGYAYVSKYERELPMRRYFVKSASGELRVHLHAVVHRSPLWQQHLLFRDALRADAGLASQYVELTLRLAAAFANDKAAYTDAKAPFIRSVLAGVGADDKEDRGQVYGGDVARPS